mgnify:CR=1 FL=1
MFSFRTTSLEEQLDKALHEGKVGCFCTQNCWDTEKGRYMYDIFRERGNLVTVFSPRDTELTPETNHIEFSVDELKALREAQSESGNSAIRDILKQGQENGVIGECTLLNIEAMVTQVIVLVPTNISRVLVSITIIKCYIQEALIVGERYVARIGNGRRHVAIRSAGVKYHNIGNELSLIILMTHSNTHIR